MSKLKADLMVNYFNSPPPASLKNINPNDKNYYEDYSSKSTFVQVSKELHTNTPLIITNTDNISR